MKAIRNTIKASAVALTLCMAVMLTLTSYASLYLPNSLQVSRGQNLSVTCQLPLNGDIEMQLADSMTINSLQTGQKYDTSFKLFGVIPVKQTTVQVVEEARVIPLGTPFGIKLYTKGVIVVAMTAVDTANGAVNPAQLAGLLTGDIITEIDGIEIASNEDISKIIKSSNGKELDFNIMREGIEQTVKFKPVKSNADNMYKAGIWVRDSSAGVGTLTFYDKNTNYLAGLGHAICDVDTGKVMPVNTGEIVEAEIIGVTKGQSGMPGELQGRFVSDEAIGQLLLNCETGVYSDAAITITGKEMEIAHKQNVHTGLAQILTTLDDTGPKYFDCEIEKVHFRDTEQTQNMVIHVTDPELLKKTGGIVQGMSGSPIIQDGKLVGAITHVFINDPTRGYGVFAENMYLSQQEIGEN